MWKLLKASSFLDMKDYIRQSKDLKDSLPKPIPVCQLVVRKPVQCWGQWFFWFESTPLANEEH